MTITVLGLGGSMRPGSTTTQALRLALEGARSIGIETRLIELATLHLPMFNGTYQIDGYTAEERANIIHLINSVDAAHGLLLASPTYHNTISGAIKNMLDLLEIEREGMPSRFTGKVVGILTVQGGTSGTGVNTLTSMLLAARAMGAWVAPTMVSIPGSREAFDEMGMLLRSDIHQRLLTLGAEVANASALFAALNVEIA